MNQRIKLLTGEVQKLPRDEQIELVESVMAELPHDPEWDNAWGEEAERRLADIRSGKSAIHDAKDVLADRRNRLTRARERRGQSRGSRKSSSYPGRAPSYSRPPTNTISSD